MKKIITSLILFAGLTFTSSSFAQTIARHVVSTAGGTLSGGGYSINHNIGEPAITTLSSGGYMITQGFEQPDDALLNAIIASLNVKAFLEGFYSDISSMRPTIFDLGISSNPTETDTITVNLWSPTNLGAQLPDHSLQAVLHTNGTASVQFPASVKDHFFYIAVKHRNHIETWSHDPVSFGATTNYDFSTGLAKAYDDGVNPPMVLMPGAVYALYGGDVNHDGTVDASDMADIDNDNSLFAFGYNISDVSGDGATDATDISIVDNNSGLFLFFARPY